MEEWTLLEFLKRERERFSVRLGLASCQRGCFPHKNLGKP